jgi:cytochrome c
MLMKKSRAASEIGFGVCGAMLAANFATAQISPPPAKPLDGAALFKQQCATCHTTNFSDPQRQGPPLLKVIGRPAGKVDGFHYSAGFAQANFVWDEGKLDAWLTDPQAVIPGAFMTYRQPKAETRAAIIGYLRELN